MGIQMLLGSNKKKYSERLLTYLDRFNKALLVNCDNVKSQQFQDIRRNLRGNTIILMGKNTLLKRCMRNYQERCRINARKWDCLSDLLRGNIGIIFTEADLIEIHATILKFKIAAPARVGAVASCDVTVHAGNT